VRHPSGYYAINPHTGKVHGIPNDKPAARQVQDARARRHFLRF
jgi:hypothetical protein